MFTDSGPPTRLPRLPSRLPVEVLAILARQDGAIATSQLCAEMGRGHLDAAVREHQLVRLWRGAYCLPDRTADVHTRLSAAGVTTNRDVVAHGRTAAQLFGFDSGRPADRLHLWTPATWPSDNPHLVMHRDNLQLPLVGVGGHRAVSRAETAVMLAASMAGPHGLAVLDGALRVGVRRSALAPVADLSCRRGITQARRLLGWADRAAESPGESWTRWVILDAGLPPPKLQSPLVTGSGRSVRFDLAWPERRVACEYDGVAFHTGSHLFADRGRMNDVLRDGWTVVHVTAPMVFGGRSALVGQLRGLIG